MQPERQRMPGTRSDARHGARGEHAAGPVGRVSDQPPATVRAQPQLVTVEPLGAEVLRPEPADQPGHARVRPEQHARRDRVIGPSVRADDGVGMWDGAWRWRSPPDRILARHLLDAPGAGAGLAQAWRVEERALLRAEPPGLVAGVRCG